MLINLKEKNSKKLVVKDYLDVDFDMDVVEINDNKFIVSVNTNYIFAEEYGSRQAAEAAMLAIMNNRNQLEYEYRDF